MAHDGPMALRIGIYGQGAWGRALGQVFGQGGHRISTWSRRAGGEPSQLLPHQDVIVCAIAMAGVPELSQRLSPVWPSGLPLISCTKGLNLQQLLSASQLWQGAIPSLSSLVLSGPNLGGELEGGLPAASVLASLHSDLAQSLQQELAGTGVSVHVICPPEVNTPMIAAETAQAVPQTRFLKDLVGTLEPDEAARKIAAGLDRRRLVIIPGFRARLVAWSARHFPAIFGKSIALLLRWKF